jgi:hypothetical protein
LDNTDVATPSASSRQAPSSATFALNGKRKAKAVIRAAGQTSTWTEARIKPQADYRVILTSKNEAVDYLDDTGVPTTLTC